MASSPTPLPAGARKINLALSISAPADEVFASLIDLPGYDAWLPQSSVFKGTTEVSDTPVKQGSTYMEHSPSGVRRGEVRVLDAESRYVVFHQPMKLKPYVLGVELDVVVDMRVVDLPEDYGGGCRLGREVTLGLPFPLRPVARVVEKQFKDESWRTMLTLKEYLEARRA